MRCPIHGYRDDEQVTFETSGALSDCYPYPALCLDCLPALVICGFQNEDDVEVDAEGEPV